MFALQHEGRYRAGKRAPDDHDVVIEIHRSKSDGLYTAPEQERE
jgi:hypothetical protein